MIENPDHFIQAFANAGADYITVHVEACPHLHRTVQLIKSFGVKAGVVLNPATPVVNIQHIIEDLDMVLLMTVNPGFGGQKFIHSVLTKITEVKQLANQFKPNLEIEIDGGVKMKTRPNYVLNKVLMFLLLDQLFLIKKIELLAD